MGREDEQTNIRLPAALKRRLEAEAAASKRTFTAEVVARLESTLSPQGELFTPAEMMEMLKRIDAKVTKAANKPPARRKKP